jgi:hypothetical protein
MKKVVLLLFVIILVACGGSKEMDEKKVVAELPEPAFAPGQAIIVAQIIGIEGDSVVELKITEITKKGREMDDLMSDLPLKLVTDKSVIEKLEVDKTYKLLITGSKGGMNSNAAQSFRINSILE